MIHLPSHLEFGRRPDVIISGRRSHEEPHGRLLRWLGSSRALGVVPSATEAQTRGNTGLYREAVGDRRLSDDPLNVNGVSTTRPATPIMISIHALESNFQVSSRGDPIFLLPSSTLTTQSNFD